jgi:UDP-N-acetyl-D-mannosaminuronic acid dehydrogenase
MKDRDIEVVIIGLGYIGLPTAALIASKGISVTGIDVNDDVIQTINQGKIHIIEPDLEGLVNYVVTNKLLKAQLAVPVADVFIVAVPTPFKEDKSPDLSYVQNAIESVIPVLKEGDLLIIESTSPVGTTEKMEELILVLRPELNNKIYMAYCPERVLPGHVIHELKNNDRVIGGVNEQSSLEAKLFYQRFVQGEMLLTNARTAEMCKLVENASRDSNIAFANELSMICDEANIDVYELIKLANHHPRVNILKPGPGVGGHCIAVDPWFIVSEFKQKANFIRLAREINDYKTEWVIDKVKNRANIIAKNEKRPAKIACLGLAFKPNIDDLRESPALHIVLELMKTGIEIMPVEPNLNKHPSLQLYPLEDALNNADLIVILVAHNQFKELELNEDYMVFCDLS